MIVVVNGSAATRGMPTTLPSQRAGLVVRRNGTRRSAARRNNRKESQMPSFSLVRPRRRRRRNMTQLAIHRGKRGRWVSDSKFASKPRKRRARKPKASKPKSRRGKSRRGRAKGTRKRNPGRRLNRRRRRRNSGLYLTNRRRRRRNPVRSNRRRRRRNSGFAVRRNRRRRRRNSGLYLTNRRRRRGGRRRRNSGFRLRRRNPGTIMGHVRNVFSITTGKDVLAATFGMSAALWGPKLAGFGLWAPLGRGYGGVATSVVSSVVASTITSFVSPSRARITLISGLAVSFAGLLSAIHCGWRTQVLPFETGLLACAMPTMPGPSVTPGSPAALALAAGTPIAQVRAMGLPGLADYVTVPRGMAGYGGGNAAGVSALLANEQAFRRAAGVNDYATFQTSESSKGMDASPETF